jgi:hypothetical protein
MSINAAILDGSVVQNVIVVASLAEAPAGSVECPAWIGVGMDINTPKPVAPVNPDEVKAEAKRRLEETDWSQVADVVLLLTNKAEFDTYRQVVREIYFNPTQTPVWPSVPNAVWG